MFRSMKMRLETTLGARGIEHIGSTAIPGMVARPTIDMLLYVESIDEVFTFAKKLEPLGWRTDDLSDNPYRTFSKFHMDSPVYRLYVVPHGVDWGEDAIRFRDRLRTDWEVAETYKVLKLRAAGVSGPEEDQFGQILGDFVRDVSKAA